MEWLVRVSEFLDRAVTRTGRLAAWLGVLLMLVVVFDVVTRRFLVLGSTKLQELEWHLHAVLFLFCLGFAYLSDAHVRIDLVRERLGRRGRWWIELLGCLFFLIPYCFVVLYFGAEWWYRSWELNEASAAPTGLPFRWIIKAALPIGFIYLLFSALSVLLRKFVQLFGPEQLSRRISAGEETAEKRLGASSAGEPERRS